MSCDRLISAIWLRVISATALDAQQKIVASSVATARVTSIPPIPPG